MKKNKKLLLALGTIATIAAPIATVVSCGSSGTTTITDGEVSASIQNYVNGSTVTSFLPTDSGKWYTPIVSDRVHDRAGNGITPFGLFDGVNQPTYDFGTLENSISYNLGYLQTGKLLMISYYKAHPEVSTDIRSSLTQLGTVLNKTFADYFKSKENDFLADAGDAHDESTVHDDVQSVLTTLSTYDVSRVIKSSAQNLTKLDYKGLDGLAEIFSQDKYLNAAPDSDEDKLGKAVMKHIGGVFTKYSWDLHKVVTNDNTVDENTKLFYAYDEVMGYSWDAFVGILGDRKTPGVSLIANGVDTTLAVDHNDLLGNYNVDAKHKNLKEFETATNSVGPYASQLYRHSALTFVESGALYAEETNDTLGSGIIPYDKGTPRYDATGALVSGEDSVRYLKFGLFDTITLIDKDGSSKVFDSDSEDATNDKSINGDAFKAAITAGAKSITAHVRDGQKYVKGGDGSDSGDKVTAEDFWTYIQNASYSTVGQRNKIETFGGQDLPVAEGADEPRNSVAKAFEDAISTSTVNKSDSWASPSKADSAAVPFFWDGIEAQYGVEAIKDTTEDHDKFVDSTNQTITFHFKDNAEESATQLVWNNLFANPGYENLKAIPTENIKTKSEALVNKITLPTGVTADQIKATPGVKYGVYYSYAAKNLSDFEYAGRYYVKKNDSSDMIWAKNENYGGFWSNKATAPDTYTNHYIDQSSAYGQTFKQAYESGDIYEAPIVDPKLKSWHDDLLALTDEEKLKQGVTYIKAHTSAGDVGVRFPTLALPFGTTAPTTAKYYFGDNFAKVTYGDTIPNLWEAPTLEGLTESLFHGTGLEFRSSLQTGINPYALVANDSKGAMGSMSTYGPEAAIPGKDSGTTHKTVLETEIFNRAAFGKNFIEVTDDDYRNIYVTASGSSVYHVGGNVLAKIKENIADALKTAGVTEGDIISELPLDYKQGLNSLNTASSLQNYLTALNSFNSHIHFVATVNPAQLLKEK